MDYFKLYKNLITRAKHRHPDFLGHLHHIVPKSIDPSLVDADWNIVGLTNREHLIAHLLLTKVIDQSEELYTKIANALLGMVYHPQTTRHAKPWLVKYARALWSKHCHQRGKPMSEANKKAINKSHVGRTHSEVEKIIRTISQVKFRLANAKGWKKQRNKYRADASHYGKQLHLGLFKTPEEARKVWSKNRLQFLAQLQCNLHGALGGV